MAVCDTGMLCSRGKCVTLPSSHTEGCQVFLTRHRELLCSCAWHPLTPSHVSGHSSSRCGAAHTCSWARPLPARTPLLLGPRKGLAIASLAAQDPLDLTSGGAREEDDPARPAALRWGGSILVLPELWVTPAAAWALRSQPDGNILCPCVRQLPCVCVCTSRVSGATFFTKWGGLAGQRVRDARGTASLWGCPLPAGAGGDVVWMCPSLLTASLLPSGPRGIAVPGSPSSSPALIRSLDMHWFFRFSQTALIRHFILLEIPLAIK